MNFLDRLDLLMSREGLNRRKLSIATGIPYTTIVGLYDKGYSNIKLSTLKRLAGFFNVSLDYLAGDEGDIPFSDRGEREPAMEKYAALSPRGRNLVDSVIDGLLDYETPEDEHAEPVEYIREYVTPAAAGIASPAEGDDYVLVPRDKSVPKGADFAVRIDGDSMEPYIADGSRVYVSRTNELKIGDVGIFFVDGNIKCKQYCEDNFGNIYLLSLNRDRSDADMTILASSGITVYCFGKVLMKTRPPII